MRVCYHADTGLGCERENPDDAARCRFCGLTLEAALRLQDPGAEAGRYRIGRVLGWGAFGAVYAAEAIRSPGPGEAAPLGRPVALKETFDPAGFTQFKQEFEVLSGLAHDNLPRYYEVFQAGEHGYLVMELVPGQNLLEVLSKQPGGLKADVVLGWAIQLCSVLTYLHGHSPAILHRDVKPANVRLTPEGEIRLVDFGLLKRDTQGTRHSLRGIGTPAYAPLEQYGLAGTDPRSDIYSLSATLYHLLTGQPPVDAVTRASAAQDPLLPPQHVNPQIPEPLAETILQGMAIRPVERYATAGQLEQALLQRGRPSLATMPMSGAATPAVPPQARARVAAPDGATRAARLPARSPRLLLAAAVVLLGLLAGMGLLARNILNPVLRPPVPPTAIPLLAGATGPPAGTMPGGWIAYEKSYDEPGGTSFQAITLVHPDGSGGRTLAGLSGANGDEMAPSWAPDGQRLVYETRIGGVRQLHIMNADGSQRIPLYDPRYRNAGDPAWSPDGQRIAFAGTNAANNNAVFGIITIGDSESGTFGDPIWENQGGGGVMSEPAWSPDGEHMAVISRLGPATQLAILDTGNADPHVQDAGTGDKLRPAWSPDGRTIAWAANRSNQWVIDLLHLDGIGLTEFIENAYNPSWSPDGRYLAFSSNRDGRWGIYIMPLTSSSRVPTRIADSAVRARPAWGP